MDDIFLLEERRKELSDWISDVSFEQCEKSLLSGKELLLLFKNYRISEKLTKLEEKSQIEAALIRTHKDAWSNKNPTELVERCIEGLNSDWIWLDCMEEGCEENLVNEVNRINRIEYLVQTLLKKASRLYDWVSSKGSVNLNEQCKLQELPTLRRKYQLLLSEIDDSEYELKQISSVASELTSLKYFDIEREEDVKQRIMNYCNEEREKIDNRISSIKEMEDQLVNLDEFHTRFAREAEKFEHWLDIVQDEVTNVKPSEILDSKGQLLSLYMDIPKVGEKLEKIHKLSEEIHTLGNPFNSCRPENPYTSLTYVHLFTRWQEIDNAIGRQLKALQNVEEENQLKQERMLARAEGVELWIDHHLKVVDCKVFNLQDRLESLRELRKKMNRYEGEFREVENLYFEMEPARLMGRVLDRCQMKILRKGWESLLTSVVKNTILTEHMIQTRDSAGMTDEEVLEHHESFEEYFRKQKEDVDWHNDELFDKEVAEAIAEGRPR